MKARIGNRERLDKLFGNVGNQARKDLLNEMDAFAETPEEKGFVWKFRVYLTKKKQRDEK